MPTELTLSFNSGDAMKAALEELSLKHDLSLEYRSATASRLITVRKGGVIVTSNAAETDVIVLIDATTGQLVTLPVYAIKIIRIYN